MKFPRSVTHADLLGVAPTVLQNGRAKRYHGDDLAISIEDFVAPDQAIIRQLYAFLEGFFSALQGDDPARESVMRTFLDRYDVNGLVKEIRTLGPASHRANPSPLLAKTVHDVRGGGFTSLIGHIEYWRLGLQEGSPCDAFYFLVRDHLKIMRNALLGLDDAKRNEDLEIKIHGTDFIVEKWNGARLTTGDKSVQLEVHCPQPVDISECCVEFGALDRILYNLLNNACRHSAGDRIQLILFPVPETQGENLRFVLLNALSESDRDHLRTLDLQSLFRAGISTTGSGYGLNVAADFVANAFGVRTPEEAVAGQYLGATLLGDHFAIWFHWPIVPGY